MLQKFIRVIEEKNIIEQKDRLVVGVSGGPDSVCLLNLLHEIQGRYDLQIFAVHINHLYRGEESNQDALFVEEMCRELNIPFYLKEIDVKRYASDSKMGFEEAGRKIRYEFFESVKKLTKSNKIATAHQMEDQAETVLMRIIRGTSIDGLAGVLEKREDGVIRPLLNFTKKEIITYLAQNNIAYRVDSSNADIHFTRNRLRNQLFQELKEINPDVTGALFRLSQFAKEDSDFIRQNVENALLNYTKKSGNKAFLVSNRLFTDCDNAVIGRVLHDIIHSLNPNVCLYEHTVHDMIRLVKSQKNGRELSLPEMIFCALEYDHLTIYQKQPPVSYNCTVHIGDCVKIQQAGMVFKTFYANYANKDNVSAQKNQILLNVPAGTASITVRSKKDGDQYTPIHFSGHRKLKEHFIDLKIPKRLRPLIPVLELNGEILWVYTGRINKRFSVHKDIKTVLVVQYEFLESGYELEILEKNRFRSENESRNHINK